MLVRILAHQISRVSVLRCQSDPRGRTRAGRAHAGDHPRSFAAAEGVDLTATIDGHLDWSSEDRERDD
jgi:hypothetical protein